MKSTKNDIHTSNPSNHLAELARKCSISEWTQECRDMSTDQLIDLIPFASTLYDPNHWKEKFHIILKRLNDNTTLEAASQKLSLEQLHEILYQASLPHAAITEERLPPLFVAMPQPLFYALIMRISPEQLNVLRHIASTEAIQHHMSILSHDITDRFDRLSTRITTGIQTLESLDLEILGLDDIKSIEHSLADISHLAAEIVHISERALALAWNTNRMDIIQELSKTKELSRRCMLEDIGCPTTEESPAVGLWATYEEQTSQLFSEKGAEGFFTAMKDTDPAMEALVKFSVWYLKDYLDIGLLPHNVSSDVHALDAASTTDAELLKKREKLFALAEQNLAKHGLKTLQDLKRERIFSRRALMDFITNH